MTLWFVSSNASIMQTYLYTNRTPCFAGYFWHRFLLIKFMFLSLFSFRMRFWRCWFPFVCACVRAANGHQFAQPWNWTLDEYIQHCLEINSAPIGRLLHRQHDNEHKIFNRRRIPIWFRYESQSVRTLWTIRKATRSTVQEVILAYINIFLFIFVFVM